jgi:hypothetical protein
MAAFIAIHQTAQWPSGATMMKSQNSFRFAWLSLLTKVTRLPNTSQKYKPLLSFNYDSFHVLPGSNFYLNEINAVGKTTQVNRCIH